MSRGTRSDLWQRLTDAGLVSGEMPPPVTEPSHWYIRVMLGAAGWLGAIFLLGFVFAGVAIIIENEAAALFVGLACCAGAWAIFRAAGRNDLAAQFGLAVSLAGQILFVYGLHEGVTGAGAAFFFGIAIFQAALAYFVDNFVHRVWCALVTSLAVSYGFVELGLFGVGSALTAIAATLLWLEEPRWASRGQLWRAIGYGLVFALLLPYWSMFGQLFAPDRGVAILIPGIHWLRPIVVAGLLVFVVYRILTVDGTASSRVESAALAAAGVIALVTLRASGVASSLIILLVGFAGGNRALTGLGVAGMLGYLSYFYYSLQATLLTKSMVLVGTGLVLIGFWAAMRYLLGEEKEAVRA